MDFFSLPVDAGPNDIPVSMDEFGNMIYETSMGTRYIKPEVVAQEGPSFSERVSILGDKLSNASWEGALEYSKALGRSMLDGVVQGITTPGRAAMGEPITMGDVFATVGMTNLGGAAMPSPKGALRSASLRTGREAVESQAQKIARYLREGKASELKDADFNIMTPADESELWGLYVSGETGMDLPMDQASRLQRAQELGFDTSQLLYHGSPRGDIKGLIPGIGVDEFGVYTAKDPSYAERYARPSQMSDTISPTMYQIYTREGPQGPVDLTGIVGKTISYKDLDKLSQHLGIDREDLDFVWQDLVDYGAVSRGKIPTYQFLEIGHRMQEELSGLANSVDFLDYSDVKGKGTWNRATFDPKDMRAPTARFDPRLSHINNLTAANASPILGLATTATSPREEIERYLESLR